MPRIEEETFTSGDKSWLGGTHGIYQMRSGVVDPQGFSDSTDYPNGYLPSGTPVVLINGVYTKYDASGSDAQKKLAGFIYNDEKVVGSELINAAILDHGRIRVANLPKTVDPATVVTSGQFTWIEEA